VFCWPGVDAEVADFLVKHADLRPRTVTRPFRRPVTNRSASDDRDRPSPSRQPLYGDRKRTPADPDRPGLAAILPPYMRRSKSIGRCCDPLPDGDIDWRLLRGACGAALQVRSRLSQSAIGRLKDGWLDEHTACRGRSCRRRATSTSGPMVAISSTPRNEQQCILVHIRRDRRMPPGELVLLHRGPRESAQELARSAARPKRLGPSVPPSLTPFADGALGFRKAAVVLPKTREQRCWVHRPRTYSPSCRRASSRRPNARFCRKSGWPKPGPRELAFDASSRLTRLNTRRRPDFLSKIGTTLLALELPGRALATPAATTPIGSTFRYVRHRTIRSK